MKQQILDALKTKFIGVNDKILGRVADRLAKTVDTAENIQDAVDNVTFQQVLDSYGDARANEAQQTAVKNYESKYGLKDGKTKEDAAAASQPQDGGDIPAWAQTLIESNKALSAQVAAMQGERKTANRKQQLSQITANLPQAIRKAYDRTPVDGLTDEEFETLKDEVTTEAAEIGKETATKGAIFGRPTVQGGSQTQQQQAAGAQEATPEEAQAVVDKLGI